MNLLQPEIAALRVRDGCPVLFFTFLNVPLPGFAAGVVGHLVKNSYADPQQTYNTYQKKTELFPCLHSILFFSHIFVRFMFSKFYRLKLPRDFPDPIIFGFFCPAMDIIIPFFSADRPLGVPKLVSFIRQTILWSFPIYPVTRDILFRKQLAQVIQ